MSQAEHVTESQVKFEKISEVIQNKGGQNRKKAGKMSECIQSHQLETSNGTANLLTFQRCG